VHDVRSVLKSSISIARWAKYKLINRGYSHHINRFCKIKLDQLSILRIHIYGHIEYVLVCNVLCYKEFYSFSFYIWHSPKILLRKCFLFFGYYEFAWGLQILWDGSVNMYIILLVWATNLPKVNQFKRYFAMTLSLIWTIHTHK
jgi:hypothetical protein